MPTSGDPWSCYMRAAVSLDELPSSKPPQTFLSSVSDPSSRFVDPADCFCLNRKNMAGGMKSTVSGPLQASRPMKAYGPCFKYDKGLFNRAILNPTLLKSVDDIVKVVIAKADYQRRLALTQGTRGCCLYSMSAPLNHILCKFHISVGGRGRCRRRSSHRSTEERGEASRER